MADHCLSIGRCEKGLMGRKGQTADESIVVDPRLGLPFPHKKIGIFLDADPETSISLEL